MANEKDGTSTWLMIFLVNHSGLCTKTEDDNIPHVSAHYAVGSIVFHPRYRFYRHLDLRSYTAGLVLEEYAVVAPYQARMMSRHALSMSFYDGRQ